MNENNLPDDVQKHNAALSSWSYPFECEIHRQWCTNRYFLNLNSWFSRCESLMLRKKMPVCSPQAKLLMIYWVISTEKYINYPYLYSSINPKILFNCYDHLLYMKNEKIIMTMKNISPDSWFKHSIYVINLPALFVFCVISHSTIPASSNVMSTNMNETCYLALMVQKRSFHILLILIGTLNLEKTIAADL